MAKDALGHGSDSRGSGPDASASRGTPIPGHPYHQKSSEQLRYIAKDASAAATAMRGHSPASEGKYLDQVNDASTVLGFRQRGGEDFSRSTPAMGSKNIAAQHDIPTEHLTPQQSIQRSNDAAISRLRPAYGAGVGYNADAVNKSIASSNRSGPKIGGKEARAIHSLLKGRH